MLDSMLALQQASVAVFDDAFKVSCPPLHACLYSWTKGLNGNDEAEDCLWGYLHPAGTADLLHFARISCRWRYLWLLVAFTAEIRARGVVGSTSIAPRSYIAKLLCTFRRCSKLGVAC